MRMSPRGSGLKWEGSQPQGLKGRAPLAVVWGWGIRVCVCRFYVCVQGYVHVNTCMHTRRYMRGYIAGQLPPEGADVHRRGSCDAYPHPQKKAPIASAARNRL